MPMYCQKCIYVDDACVVTIPHICINHTLHYSVVPAGMLSQSNNTKVQLVQSFCDGLR